MTAAVLGASSVLAAGSQNLSSSPADAIVAQKAAEAIEGVFAARDSHALDWSKIRNVHGASGSDNGVFLDGPQPLGGPGSDGLVNTADDAVEAPETIQLAGLWQSYSEQTPSHKYDEASLSKLVNGIFGYQIDVADAGRRFVGEP